ncbi:hypothetical protein [Streptomyces boncukensis]|uniref:Uncharacterized protein n=1 Tax=Streptomyces boncukensis TaxID=2711219 RepID=A0A6G4WQL8_9ACTN|nr:hypothetical protein [Streptomyces boncukensis]NGO66791.1 hypothetical protein [Streptomyces boncukensis]
MTDDELTSLVRSLPSPDADLLAARRAAEEQPAPEPDVVPMPEFVPGGIVRFHCAHGCGWHHDENPGLDDAAEPYAVRLPADPTSADISAALTEVADSRAQAVRTRVEDTIVEHYREKHGTAA